MPASNREKKDAEAEIKEWSSDGARGTGTSRSNLVGNGRRNTNFRIDMQRRENHMYDATHGIPYERYALQSGSRTFAVVHIEVGKFIPSELIRAAFTESMSKQTHVFIFKTKINDHQINTPNDGLTYSYKHDKKRDVWTYSGTKKP